MAKSESIEITVAAAEKIDKGRTRTVADGALTLQPIAAVRVSDSRGAPAQAVTVRVPADALVEIELEGGVCLWRLAEDAAAVAPASARGGLAAAGRVIPATADFGTPGRGIGRFAIRVVRFFRVETMADAAARRAAELIEAKLAKGPGLYGAADPHDLTEAGALPTDQPVLLLLHGNASNTAASFGGLARRVEPRDGDSAPAAPDRPHWHTLQERYADRSGSGRIHIYGFEHRTLTESPVDNAVALLRALPAGARLHLVTHSRGGLIGELLARARSTRLDGAGRPIDSGTAPEPVDARDLEIFRQIRSRGGRDAGSDREMEQLRTLNRLLIEKRPVVERFVRVACPARGALLASDRLDLYLSVLLNLIGLIPGPTGLFHEPFKAFVQAMVASRTRPETLPGLEAMMPDAPLIAMLNRHDVRIDGHLAMIAGDIEASGVLGTLATIATDLFFREDHDVVVDSRAMLGGARREPPASYFFDKGGEVSHFGYFRNERTAGKLVEALQGDPTSHGFHPLEHPQAPMIVRGSSTDRARPVCFVLPGLMGSNLKQRDDRIWLEFLEVLCGGIGRLGIGQQNIRPDGVIAACYGALAGFLGPSHAVVPFAYDWRLSLRAEAGRLAAEIERTLARTDQPVRILAHSMGGLVARLMLIDHPDTWRKMTERPGSRLVMLGTPNGGSVAIAAGLMGRDRTIRRLERLDITRDMAEITAIVGSMPGVLELLPHDLDGSYYRPETWAAWSDVDAEGWQRPDTAALTAADPVRRALAGGGIDPLHMVYVAGQAAATPSAIEVVDGPCGPRLRLVGTAFGDGRVPWRTGLLKDVPTWYAPTEHGDLSRDRRNFDALLDLLAEGATRRLPSIPAAGTRGIHGQFEMGLEPVLYPDAAALAALPMGGSEQLAAPGPAPCRVTILHGDLAYARHPVVVGHYEGGELIGAEGAIDRRLGGRLDMRRRLDLYPGRLRTAEVVFAAPGESGLAGAVVCGLGAFGELTGKRLAGTLSTAYLGYALRNRERMVQNGAQARDNGLSCLLIGHRDSAITLQDTLTAMLEAVVIANAQLEAQDRIAELELVEIFEDTAIEAARVLSEFAREGRFRGELDIAPRLGALPGGRRRQDLRREAEWQQRVVVEVDEANPARLLFTSLNRRALSREDDAVIERDRIERYLAEATEDTRSDPELGKLLFEWLVPPPLKGFASEARRLLFQLDRETAAYPWELLEDGFDGSGRPIALQASVIRQLRHAGTDMAIPAKPGRALLIADPETNGAYPRLNGAVAEVEAVAGRLRERGWAFEGDAAAAGPAEPLRPDGSRGLSVKLVRQPERRIMPTLSLGEHQVLHIAAHGVHDPQDPGRSGLVVGAGQLVTPAFVRTLRRMPEFVFLNCCHLGAIAPRQPVMRAAPRNDRPRLAANLAEAFIRGGARAVVAAGWEVSDGAATAFAAQLYHALLAGRSFGEATLEARRAAREAAPDTNTWGAYQCYGDPQYRLSRDPMAARTAPSELRFSAMQQAIVALHNIAREAAISASGDEVRGLRDQVAAVEAALRGQGNWLADARLSSALADAWCELDCLDKADGYYRSAARADPAAMPVSAVERMLDGQVRALVRAQRHRPDAKARKTLAKALVRAIDKLEALNMIGDQGTAGRHCLIGTLRLHGLAAAEKQAADDAGSAAGGKALDDAARSFERATELLPGTLKTGKSEPELLLLLVAAIRFRRCGGDHPPAILDRLDRIRALPRAPEQAPHCFADAVREMDAALLQHIVGGTVAEQVETLLQGYARARRRGASAREIGCIVDRLYLVAELVRPGSGDDGVGAALLRIARDLEQITAVG